ncbi:MAG: type IV pilus modification protein PilV [Rudaea sp.]
MRYSHSSRGFTLLEVLIALLIFSLGVLGMAGLLAVSVRTNHSAYLRTQATFLAQSMADRMRANASWALWTNLYNSPAGGWTAPVSPTNAANCQSGGSKTSCTYADVANRDIAVWTAQIARFLPNATESINCSGAPSIPISTYPMLPPYGGTCTVSISWNESTLVVAGSPNTETLSWVFQP